MSELYNRIEALCRERKVSITQMCKDSGASRAPLTELKMNRTKQLSIENLQKIATYFNVTTDYLLGAETEKDPAGRGEVSEDDLKFALFGGEATDKQLDEVRRFAQFIKERDAK